MTFENLTLAENFIDPDSNTFWTKGFKKKKKNAGGIHVKAQGTIPGLLKQPGNSAAVGVGVQALLISPPSYTASSNVKTHTPRKAHPCHPCPAPSTVSTTGTAHPGRFPQLRSGDGSTLRASFIFSELLGPELLSWNRWFRVMSSQASSWLRGILRFPRQHWCCSSFTCQTRQSAQRWGWRQNTQEGPKPHLRPPPSTSCRHAQRSRKPRQGDSKHCQ